MKNSNGTIGNRTRDIPTCSVGPQLTALPRAPRASEAKSYLYLSLIEDFVQGCTNQGRKVAVEINFMR